jgi:hypothetical protein
VSATGPQLVYVTTSDSDPQFAIASATAVAEEFTYFFAESLTTRSQHKAELLAPAAAQAKNALAEAEAALTTYNGGRANTNSPDPTEARLSQILAEAQAAYSLAQQDITHAHALASISIDDAIRSSDVTGVPTLRDKPTDVITGGRKKTIVVAGIGSLVGGATVSALLLALYMSRDRAIRRGDELEESFASDLLAVQRRRDTGFVDGRTTASGNEGENGNGSTAMAAGGSDRTASRPLRRVRNGN